MLEYVCDVEGCAARMRADDPPTALPPGWASVTTFAEPIDPTANLPPIVSQVVHAGMAMSGFRGFRESQRHLLCSEHAWSLPHFKGDESPKGISVEEQAEILAEYEKAIRAQGETP